MGSDPFDQDSLGSGAEGMPSRTSQADVDVNISNTGQRVRAIIVVVIIVVAAIAAIVWYLGRQGEIEQHEQVRTEYQRVHTMGYVDFWTKTQVDIKEMKTNTEFETKMKQLISDQPVAYGKYVKEKCLPILDKALPEYKAISTPSAYADKMDKVAKAAEDLRAAWNGYADQLLKYEDYFKVVSKGLLDKAGNAWLGAQQSTDEKYTANAYKYFLLLGCVLPDAKIEEIETTEINVTVQDSCLNNKSEWFRRVAFDCMPRLLGESQEPNEAYSAALNKSRKSERMDHASKFAIEDCIKATKDEFESDIIEKVALAWRGYVTAQNELLTAIDEQLAELR